MLPVVSLKGVCVVHCYLYYILTTYQKYWTIPKLLCMLMTQSFI